MDEIIELWETLVTATEKKGEKLQEASQQQQFNRTVEDIELWLSEIEGQLQSEDYGKVCILGTGLGPHSQSVEVGKVTFSQNYCSRT